MVGFTCSMPRREAVPLSIEHGADIFLFTIDQKEDVGYMTEGLKNGLLSRARLDEAVTRILALKASLGLHRGKELVPDISVLQKVLRCPEHLQWAAELADRCVTLVKDREGLLPLSPAKTPKVKLIMITNEKVAPGDFLPEVKLFKELLEKEGFQVDYFKNCAYPGAGISLADYRKETDLLIYYANMKVSSNQTTIRITWTISSARIPPNMSAISRPSSSPSPTPTISPMCRWSAPTSTPIPPTRPRCARWSRS